MPERPHGNLRDQRRQSCLWQTRLSISSSNEAGSKRSGKIAYAELNTDLRSFAPSHAAIADGCVDGYVVKHKIK
jgi:hypothetical protein